MADTDADPASTDLLLRELRSWLSANWDADMTVGEWWARLGLAGWAAPGLPTHAYGKAIARADVVAVQDEIAAFGALGAPAGMGLLLAAPTIAQHGTQEQIDLYVRDIVTGQRAWCQLFSEPQAGSDLAGLQTRAVNDGGEWVINGQKVWTSRGREADIGMLLARTDPAAPKHRGISYFAFPMHQAGVDIRPLREMTGYALFNEVFITDARVDDSALIGGVNNGWAAANTTLLNERAGLGAGGGNAADGGAIQPGTHGGFLERRAGDLVASSTTSKSRTPRHHGGSSGLPRGEAALLIDIAKRRGLNTDVGIRQDLVKLHTLSELGRFNGLRAKAASEQGRSIAGMPNIAKLSMSQSVRLARDVGLRILGPTGTLYGYEPEDKALLKSLAGASSTAGITGRALFAQAPSIYGGTDQIQRNIIGERVLGLPKEPGDDRQVPFSDLPKNA